MSFRPNFDYTAFRALFFLKRRIKMSSFHHLGRVGGMDKINLKIKISSAEFNSGLFFGERHIYVENKKT